MLCFFLLFTHHICDDCKSWKAAVTDIGILKPSICEPNFTVIRSVINHFI